jgi:hypothetical protein
VKQKFGRIAIMACIGVAVSWGITRAYISKYQQKRSEILAACKAEKDKMTPEALKQLPARCGTPEISLVSPAAVKPGDTVDVMVSGKFPAGTNFLFESDSIEVLKESSAANSYRATIKVAPGGGPEKVAVSCFIPACCKSARNDLMAITGNFEWDLKAANGWTLKASSIASPAGLRELAYSIEFFRGAETAPFEKRRATLYPSQGDPPSYSFSISTEDQATVNTQEQLQTLAQQMQNPKISDAEREALMKKMNDMMTTMTKDMGKMTDPAYIKQLQAKELEFGCRNINLTLQNGSAKGNLNCSEKVGRNIVLTGTLKTLAK